MELNREQIVKALECCAKDDCDNCPNPFGNCYANLAGYALALIRELTEEKERLAHESACHRQTVIDNLRESLDFINEETERVRADTIREMQERLKDEMDYVARCEFDGQIYFCIGKGFVDQIAQEMMEESDDNT